MRTTSPYFLFIYAKLLHKKILWDYVSYFEQLKNNKIFTEIGSSYADFNTSILIWIQDVELLTVDILQSCWIFFSFRPRTFGIFLWKSFLYKALFRRLWNLNEEVCLPYFFISPSIFCLPVTLLCFKNKGIFSQIL